MIEAVVKELVVAASPEKAFDVFTLQMGDWWPLASHSLSEDQGVQTPGVNVEPFIGGKITEQLSQGGTADWGVITDWQRPVKVAFSWHLRKPKAEQTHVSVEFTSHLDGTFVRLIHSGWDAQHDEGAKNREEYNGGWEQVFKKCYGDMFKT